MKHALLLKKRGAKEPGKSGKSIQDDLTDKKKSSQFELEDNRPEMMVQLKLESLLDEEHAEPTSEMITNNLEEEPLEPIHNDAAQEEKTESTQLMADEEKEVLA